MVLGGTESPCPAAKPRLLARQTGGHALMANTLKFALLTTSALGRSVLLASLILLNNLRVFYSHKLLGPTPQFLACGTGRSVWSSTFLLYPRKENDSHFQILRTRNPIPPGLLR